MSERNNRRVDNVRLVRMPDGRLVMASDEQPRSDISEQTPKVTDADVRAIERQRQENITHQRQISNPDSGGDIQDVWEEQIRLKEEGERLELEYKIAKKMAKELKQKMRERNQVSVDGVDPVFQDLLSPETKDLAQKVAPIVGSGKSFASHTWKAAIYWAKVARVLTISWLKKLRTSPVAVVVTLLVIVVLGGGGFALFGWVTHSGAPQDVKSATDSNDGKKAQITLNDRPSFKILLPKGKSLESLGGVARVSPPNVAPAYTYKDIVEGITVRVTQQELPEAFKSSPLLEVEKVAKSFNATTPLQVDQNLIYLGKSEKGPQTGIFAKDGLLVIINTDQELSDVYWVQYVTSLTKQ